ncbi:MAG: 4Fe-4S binding protein [Clostridia bacterium]|nr:4Fe-4S binding protein [Clostridia bacterium]
MVDKEKCIGCGACVGCCPVGAISLDENGQAKIDPNICIKCLTCESVCPVSAITIEKKE